MIDSGEKMLFIEWIRENSYHYHLIISMQNTKGALADVLTHLAKVGLDIETIELGKTQEEHTKYCEIEFESDESEINLIRSKIERDRKIKIIQLVRTDDAYRTVFS